jgi:hypothetical protein
MAFGVEDVGADLVVVDALVVLVRCVGPEAQQRPVRTGEEREEPSRVAIPARAIQARRVGCPVTGGQHAATAVVEDQRPALVGQIELPGILAAVQRVVATTHGLVQQLGADPEHARSDRQTLCW